MADPNSLVRGEGEGGCGERGLVLVGGWGQLSSRNKEGGTLGIDSAVGYSSVKAFSGHRI